MEIQNKKYSSPRISTEIHDCALPLTFDQYSRCSFGCLYCFAAMQRCNAKGVADSFRAGEVSSVNVEKIKSMFLGQIEKGPGRYLYETLIKKRIPLHWGGLGDPADEYERNAKVGLELIGFFREINYPVFQCFKGNTFHTEPEYAEVFRGADNFAHQFSIISLDEEKCKKVEKGTPNPWERLRCMEVSSKEWGLPVYLRLRPYIVGMSDETAEQLLEESAKRGAKAVSIEFMCLDIRADEFLMKRYRAMSEAVGFDIYDFYKCNSRTGETYRRLSPEVKMPILLRLRNVAHKLGMRFAVSGPIGKHLNDTGCCCGLPDDGGVWGNWSDAQFTSALLKSKSCGECSFKGMLGTRFGIEHLTDLGRHSNKGEIAVGQWINLGSSDKHATWHDANLEDWLRFAWNQPKRASSPASYFWGLMAPDRLDEDDDIVYKYNPKAFEGADK